MKSGVFLVCFLLLFSTLVVAQEKIEHFTDISSLELAFALSSGVEITPTQGKSVISYIQTDLSFFPKDGQLQSILDFNANAVPNAKVSTAGEYTTYKWVNAKPSSSLSFGVDATVKTKNAITKISSPLSFPVSSVESEVLEFTKPTEFIDLNSAIEQQAYAIIGGETDLYKATFKLADWTRNNIEYDLNTLTAEAVQKSSWVLQNKEGVCDEMTNLFISFSRSVGLPARFVSGMVYTNLDYSWGPHGWAEVYFPSVGWVPFDVTFGQYGWIDPSHIKLKESLDSGSPSAEYSWQASGVDVNLLELSPSVSLIKSGAPVVSPLSISIEPLRENVGFGSFVPLLVTVSNTASYYVSSSIIIRKAPSLIEDNTQEVLLKPGESKTIGWITTIPSNLEKNYVYTGVLEVESSFGDSASSKIVYAAEYPVLKEKDARKVLHNLEKREEKPSLSSLKVSCSTTQELFYANESALINCAVENTASSAVTADVCARADCQEVSLSSNEMKQVSFAVDLQTSARIPITAETPSGVASSFVNINLVTLPSLYVSDLKPDAVKYGDTVQVVFNVNSDSELQDVQLEFVFGSLDLASFKGAKQITIDTDGKSLFMRGLKFSAQFTDEKGVSHTQNIAIPVVIKDVPWYAKFSRWLRNLF